MIELVNKRTKTEGKVDFKKPAGKHDWSECKTVLFDTSWDSGKYRLLNGFQLIWYGHIRSSPDGGLPRIMCYGRNLGRRRKESLKTWETILKMSGRSLVDMEVL